MIFLVDKMYLLFKMKDKELLTIDEEKLRAEITKAQEYFK